MDNTEVLTGTSWCVLNHSGVPISGTSSIFYNLLSGYSHSWSLPGHLGGGMNCTEPEIDFMVLSIILCA